MDKEYAGTVGRSMNQYEAAAKAWSEARTRYMDSLEAHGRAVQEMNEAEAQEKAAWAQMEKVSERNQMPVPLNTIARR